VVLLQNGLQGVVIRCIVAQAGQYHDGASGRGEATDSATPAAVEMGMRDETCESC
jgi:hypothetical protein